MIRLLEQPCGYEKLLTVLKPKEHRVLPIPSRETLLKLLREGGEARVYELFKRRDEAIELEAEDPVEPAAREVLSVHDAQGQRLPFR